MNRISYWISSLCLCTITITCCAQEPITDRSPYCTRLTKTEQSSGNNAGSMISFFKENPFTSTIVIGLIALGTYIYYRHIHHYPKNQTSLTKNSSEQRLMPAQPMSIPNRQFLDQATLVTDISTTNYGALKLSISEKPLQEISSQPNLGDLVNPPTYAHPIAMRLKPGSPFSDTGNPISNELNSGLSSPTSCASISKSYRDLVNGIGR